MSTSSTYVIIRNQLFLMMGLSTVPGMWLVTTSYLMTFGHYGLAVGSLFLSVVFCLWVIYRCRLLLRLIRAAADYVDLEIQPEVGK